MPQPSDYAKRLAEVLMRPSEDSFFIAIGRLVTEYALAETAVHSVARAVSGLSDEHARIIFGGMRLKDIVARIKGLKSGDAEFLNEFESCMGQLDCIGDNRDRLAHRAVHYFEGQLLVTNTNTAKSMASIEIQMFPYSELTDMCTDCVRIFLRLNYLADPVRREKSEKANQIGHVYGPWQYKLVPPKNRSRGNSPDAQKAHPHQRGASPK